MHTILVDTREQKTPIIFDRYLQDHPIIAKELLILNHVLDIGDVAGSDQIFECKWGSDLESSLKSGHLEDQLRRLASFCYEKGFIPHLVCADRENTQITLLNFKWAVQLAQRYGVWVHHKRSITDALELIIHLVRNPAKRVILNLPVSSTKKSNLLIRMLSQIEGVTPEFAEFAIPECAKSMNDLCEHSVNYWESKLKEYYKKDMGALLARIIEAL